MRLIAQKENRAFCFRRAERAVLIVHFILFCRGRKGRHTIFLFRFFQDLFQCVPS